jgi:serine/threonine protein kinase
MSENKKDAKEIKPSGFDVKKGYVPLSSNNKLVAEKAVKHKENALKSESKITILQKTLKEKKEIETSLGKFNYQNQIAVSVNGYVGQFEINAKIFAIKFLITNETGNSELVKRKRFIAEYINVITLPPNFFVVSTYAHDVLAIKDGEITYEIPYIIMKKYEGTLKQYKNEKPTKEKFKRLFDFFISSLSFIHQYGIIHRDLKPENIFIENDGFVIGDFGISFYDPEKFVITSISEPKNKERLGNRMFSAPEQQNPNEAPKVTMDIYSLGQILQWYATSETHQGTGRKNIGKEIDEFGIYDSIIEKCLKNNPLERFQSINEIVEFKKNYIQQKNHDEFAILDRFNVVIIKTFPKISSHDLLICSDKTKIDILFENLKSEEVFFGNNLWHTNGMSTFWMRVLKNRNENWSINIDEYNIDTILVSIDSSTINDLILIKYKKDEPFVIDGKETYLCGFVDEKHYISANEFDNGYAEIENETIDLSTRKKRLIHRQEKVGWVLISTRYSCALQTKNDKIIENYIDNLLQVEENAIGMFDDFRRAIRKNIHPDVMMQL